MATYRTILTKKGKELIAAAGASGTPIVLTDMAAGDGNGNAVTPVETQTSLARERYRHAVNQLTVDVNDPSRFTAELLIPASVGGFTMREVGLYTSNADLFAVANVPAAYKPTNTEGSFGDTVIRMVFVVSNASVVTLVADPNVAVATHTWVMNNVNAATIIPGGFTNQFLAKNSNADGDTKWVDPTSGITVIVFSREETQTLAAGQTIIDLAVITSEGAAVYIEGTRLRAAEFSYTSATRITLASSHPAGSKVTVVQNEELGNTDVLQRPNNLSDVPDKVAARANLGLPNWLASSSIDWGQLVNLPDYATRWPTWGEVTGKPTTFAPSAHNQDWTTIDNKPDTATRWPTWNEVTSKPTTFTPATHTHAISDVSGLQTSLDSKVAKSGDTMTGVLYCNGASGSVPIMLRTAAGVGRYYFGNSETQFDISVMTDAGVAVGPAISILRSSRDVVFAAKATSTGNITVGGGSLQVGGDAGSYTRLAFNGVVTTNAGIIPTSFGTFALKCSGGYGGGFGLIDGSNNIGFWSNAGNLKIGFATNLGSLSEALTLTTGGALSTAGGFDFGSSLKLKEIEGEMPYGLAEVRRISTLIGRYKPEYNQDGRRRVFFDADAFAKVIPEAVDLEGVEFNGEKVAAMKLDQVMPPAYRAIAELADLVEELREEIAALKAGR